MSKAAQFKSLLTRAYPWIQTPFIVGAPMRVMSGASLAVAISEARGLGFIGPGAKAGDIFHELEAAKTLLAASPALKQLEPSVPLPIGVGFQTWNGDLDTAVSAVHKYMPCAAWLFAPRHGQKELDEWTDRIRRASEMTKIWVQVGSLCEALDAAQSVYAPDILVLQGTEAGGHGRAVDGMGLITLLPEIQDKLDQMGSTIPLLAGGGIADGRGVVAAFGLGAAGVVMGTRFLASTEARIAKGYQDEIIRANNGAVSTVRTHLYNHLRGTFGWPEQFSPRTVVNQTWVDHKEGVAFEELQKRHNEAVALGDGGWGPDGRLATYAGANIGLIHSVGDAASIVQKTRDEAVGIIKSLQ
ncbi:hypothetical protein BROUX41_001902 [Berkeleyomyces rouxiae]|uniref:uncharacterized protein n=1 Tax=Berkeleyomyces rouxiae TaxID=2035830 RepID=UPI003B81F9A9